MEEAQKWLILIIISLESWFFPFYHQMVDHVYLMPFQPVVHLAICKLPIPTFWIIFLLLASEWVIWLCKQLRATMTVVRVNWNRNVGSCEKQMNKGKHGETTFSAEWSPCMWSLQDLRANNETVMPTADICLFYIFFHCINNKQNSEEENDCMDSATLIKTLVTSLTSDRVLIGWLKCGGKLQEQWPWHFVLQAEWGHALKNV